MNGSCPLGCVPGLLAPLEENLPALKQIAGFKPPVQSLASVNLHAIDGDGTILEKLPGFPLGTGKTRLGQKIHKENTFSQSISGMR